LPNSKQKKAKLKALKGSKKEPAGPTGPRNEDLGGPSRRTEQFKNYPGCETDS